MPWFLLLISRHRLRTKVCLLQAHLNHQEHHNLQLQITLLPPFWPQLFISAVKQALATKQYYCKLQICPWRLQQLWPWASRWQPCLGVFLVRLCLLASLMLKLQLWQPRALAFCLSLWLLPLPRSRVGLILFYLHLSLHLPWLLHLASVVFLSWPRCLFCISCSQSALAFRQFLQNLWARSWLENLLKWMSC